MLTSSITGNRTGATGLAIYGASKAAMNGMMRSMALEFAKDEITINAVEPGRCRHRAGAEGPRACRTKRR